MVTHYANPASSYASQASVAYSSLSQNTSFAAVRYNLAQSYANNANSSTSQTALPISSAQQQASQAISLAAQYSNNPQLVSYAAQASSAAAVASAAINAANAATSTVNSANVAAISANAQASAAYARGDKSAGDSYAAAASSAAGTAASASVAFEDDNMTIVTATQIASSAASRAASDYATIIKAAKMIFVGINNAADSASSNGSGSGDYYAQGLSDAKNGYQYDTTHGSQPTYAGAFDGYIDAFNGKKAKTDFTGKAAEYQSDYARAYQVGHEAYLKAVAAGKKAAKADTAAKSSLAGKSAGYKYGYAKAFNAKLKKHPLYIYNTKTVYVHNKATFGTDSRIKKYSKQPRNKVHEFKIKRIAVTKSGLVRYYVKNHLTASVNKNKGYITANRKYIVNAYYSKAEMSAANSHKVKVIATSGVRSHKSTKFTSNSGKYYKQGSKLNVDRIVKYKGLTRFYIGHGKYLTSNKKFVKFI